MTIATPFTILVVLIITFFNITQGIQFHSRNTSSVLNKKIKNTVILHTHKTDSATTGTGTSSIVQRCRSKQIRHKNHGDYAMTMDVVKARLKELGIITQRNRKKEKRKVKQIARIVTNEKYLKRVRS